jgi:hypothetical protein
MQSLDEEAIRAAYAARRKGRNKPSLLVALNGKAAWSKTDDSMYLQPLLFAAQHSYSYLNEAIQFLEDQHPCFSVTVRSWYIAKVAAKLVCSDTKPFVSPSLTHRGRRFFPCFRLACAKMRQEKGRKKKKPRKRRLCMY